MPELPEVEIVVRTLAPHVEGRRIRAVHYLAPRAALGEPDWQASQLGGRIIGRLRRMGKHIVFELDSGIADVHLRMTGKLLWQAEPGPYARATIETDAGRLVFDDVRQFGYLVWRPILPKLGPDPLDITEAAFALLLNRRRRIKPLLLDQETVAGLGNIYVDEALHRAGIHPLAQAFRLSKARRARLHNAIAEVLQEAIEAGGSSISDYVDAAGQPGSFQLSHRVYGREGQPCLRCGTPVRRIVIAQRGTHFCLYCQRR